MSAQVRLLPSAHPSGQTAPMLVDRDTVENAAHRVLDREMDTAPDEIADWLLDEAARLSQAIATEAARTVRERLRRASESR